ncbi:MAG: serine hydrolase domain-containing protein, partial [Wenzhouxiangellaceae bacterium]
LFATMVLRATDAGAFDLDAPLARHWTDPDLADDARHAEITARLALSHQTGLPNWRGGQPLAFKFDPGTGHEYSGEGFEYVRRAVERASGENMRELMARHVVDPAGMKSTWFGWNTELEGRVATGFDEQKRPIDMAYLQQRAPNAAANTFTSVRDYARFLAWVAGGAGLTEARLDDMTRPRAAYDDPAEFFSLGWRVIRIPTGTVLSHDGRENGVRTQAWIQPDSGEGLVILTNSSNGELMPRPLAEQILSYGSELMDRTDRDTWHWILAQPPEAHQPMLGYIARSPSFVSKLLHAVANGAIAPLDAELARQAEHHIAPLVLALHQQRITADDVARLFARLIEPESSPPVLRPAYGHNWAVAWVEAVSELAAAAP